KLLQSSRIGDAAAKRSYNAGDTRFIENNSVATAFDDPATKFRRDNRQAVRLRFELRNREAIGQRRKNEHVCVSIKMSCLFASYRTKPFHACGIRCCSGVCYFYRSNEPKFNRLITQ